MQVKIRNRRFLVLSCIVFAILIFSFAVDMRLGDELPDCPPFPSNLSGVMKVSNRSVPLGALNGKYARHFKEGGFYAPTGCKSLQKGESRGWLLYQTKGVAFRRLSGSCPEHHEYLFVISRSLTELWKGAYSKSRKTEKKKNAR